ncbi:response regulator [Flavobacterium restrictum]|uniref:Response regulator n=1 Tax=Flavobacterium restrictum TaxID=2594428 RepID=A0A553E704_9FLAO|nr:response regulator [Flavobacterium restrictum]TRX40796.1 response regulator [Flavobacterium restrictum]
MNKFDLTYIVDDDAIFVSIFKKILSKIQNFSEIKHLKNGAIALSDLKKRFDNKQVFPDIIFLDLNMPVLDGWQFLEELKQLPFKNQLAIYVISSTIDKREIKKCRKYKTVLNFIQKPTNESQLKAILGI